jgi:hypothetical protein
LTSLSPQNGQQIGSVARTLSVGSCEPPSTITTIGSPPFRELLTIKSSRAFSDAASAFLGSVAGNPSPLLNPRAATNATGPTLLSQRSSLHAFPS